MREERGMEKGEGNKFCLKNAKVKPNDLNPNMFLKPNFVVILPFYNVIIYLENIYASIS